MSLFDVNWRTRVTNLLPSFKRSVSLVDFITALLEGLVLKSTEWTAFDADVSKRARFNSQIIVLQAALNNIFGVTSSPFILVETSQLIGQSLFIYNSSEGFQPTYIYNSGENSLIYIYNSSEISIGASFVVKIPSGIYTTELDRRIKSEVTTYKLSGMTFSTETY
jgi:hypothetical protein